MTGWRSEAAASCVANCLGSATSTSRPWLPLGRGRASRTVTTIAFVRQHRIRLMVADPASPRPPGRPDGADRPRPDRPAAPARSRRSGRRAVRAVSRRPDEADVGHRLAGPQRTGEHPADRGTADQRPLGTAGPGSGRTTSRRRTACCPAADLVAAPRRRLKSELPRARAGAARTPPASTTRPTAATRRRAMVRGQPLAAQATEQPVGGQRGEPGRRGSHDASSSGGGDRRVCRALAPPPTLGRSCERR